MKDETVNNLIIKELSDNDHKLDIQPTHNLVFNDSKGEVGRLEFTDGELRFSGNMDKSTVAFLEFLQSSFKDAIDKEVNMQVQMRNYEDPSRG